MKRNSWYCPKCKCEIIGGGSCARCGMKAVKETWTGSVKRPVCTCWLDNNSSAFDGLHLPPCAMTKFKAAGLSWRS